VTTGEFPAPMNAMLPRPGFLTLALLLVAVAPATAQLPALGVPRGKLRVELTGRFQDWSQRFRDGTREDAAADFIRSNADATWLPTLSETEAVLARIAGGPVPGLSLGRSDATLLASAGAGGIGLAFGITSRITVFGNLPFVRMRVQQTLGLDSTTANLGLNPAHPAFGTDAGRAQAVQLLNELSAVLATLGLRLQSGDYDTDPALKALAEATLARGTAMRMDLDALFGELSGSPFLPVVGTPAAATLAGAIDELRATLETNLQVPGFTAAAPLPVQRVSGAEFLGVVTAAGGPFAFRPLPSPIIMATGDAELGASFTWLERRSATGRVLRSVFQGTVRLPTGYLARSDELLALSSGDRQLDLQGDLVTDIEAGGFGARLTGRYVYQRPGRIDTRVRAPDQPIAPSGRLTQLVRDPGEIIEGMVEPYVRIAPSLALVGGARLWSKGEDRWTYAPGSAGLPGVDPQLLGRGSRERAVALSAGVSFVHSGVRRDGTRGQPMEAGLRYEWVAASSAGRVAATRGISILLRFYR
jgi:hypothetical protein